MILIFFAFLAGMATVLSPCILPILPIILSGTVGGKWRPYGIILGFVLSFSIFTIFLTTLVSKLGLDLDVLRAIAAGLLVFLGLVLIFPILNNWFKSIIPNLQINPKSKYDGFAGGFMTGVPLGLIWAPCAGPILAAVITVAAASEAGLLSLFIILAYSLGTSAVMLFVVLGSRWVISTVKGLSKYSKIIQQIFGVLIVLTGIAMATGYDRNIQTAILNYTPIGWTEFLHKFESSEIVTKEINKLQNIAEEEIFENKNFAPEIIGIEAWINSEGEILADLRGKVVLIDFWTYSCINCIRTLPFVTSWYEKYKDDGFVIIGVHTPEFAFERKLENVQDAVKEFEINYPVALDNDYKTWRNFKNRYWPAHYLIDKKGRIRYTHFGEGKYDETEMMIRELLEEDADKLSSGVSEYSDEVPYSRRQTAETYLGYGRLENFVNMRQLTKNVEVDYMLAEEPDLNHWSLGGKWEINKEHIVAAEEQTRLNLNFNGKNVFLVMGADEEKSIQIKLNGKNVDSVQKGHDVDEKGIVKVSDFKLYRLIEADSFLEDSKLELIFPEGVRAFAFTFGS